MRSQARKAITLLTICVVGFVLGFWVWRQRDQWSKQSLQPLRPENVPPNLGLDVEGVNGLVIRAHGKKQWELTAKKIRISKDRSLIQVEGLTKAVYYREEKPILTLAAKHLRFNSESRNLEISGGVWIQTIHSLNITTSFVRWIAAEKRILCPRGASASVKGLVFKTSLVSFFPETNRLECPRSVRVAFGRGGFMQADRLTADVATETVDLIGNIFCRARVGRLKMPFSL